MIVPDLSSCLLNDKLFLHVLPIYFFLERLDSAVWNSLQSSVLLHYGVVSLSRNDSCGIVNVISTGYQNHQPKIYQVNKCPLASQRSLPPEYIFFIKISDFCLKVLMSSDRKQVWKLDKQQCAQKRRFPPCPEYN